MKLTDRFQCQSTIKEQEFHILLAVFVLHILWYLIMFWLNLFLLLARSRSARLKKNQLLLDILTHMTKSTG